MDFIMKFIISVCIAVGLVAITSWLLGDRFTQFWICTFIFLILMNALRDK